jgi:hypothetical protein
MGKEIETRTIVKDIKVVDRAVNSAAHMKNALIRSKQAAETTRDPQHHSASEYATDHVTDGAEDISQAAAHRLRNPHKKAAENVGKATERFERARQQLPKARKEVAEQAKRVAETTKTAADRLSKTANKAPRAVHEAQRAVVDARRTLQQTRQVGRQTVRAAEQTGKGVKVVDKGVVKTVKKSIKTSERTAKVTLKTAQKTAKATQKSAKAAAKSAKAAAQASQAAAKAAVQAAKLAAKAIAAMVKSAIAAIEGLVALIAAGGWVAVMIIIVICLIGLLLGSVFGIFFSDEDSGNGYTMPMAIAELNAEYDNELAEIKNGTSHDEVQMSGTCAEWEEILAVYAVKVNTDPDNAQDVVTMDEHKKELLRSVFWDMNRLSHRIETREVTEVTDEGNGENSAPTETTVTRTILHITVSHKTATEMAEQYGFSRQQKAQLAELLADEYVSLWNVST